MSLRSWVIRGFILAGVAALVVVVWLANSWVSPERVRAQVIEHLSAHFENVDVQVGSARMRILGGIAVRDIKLTRRGSSGDVPFLTVPTAVLYHDKEQLNRGQLIIKKIELENPEFNLERSADGSWNVGDIRKDSPADKPLPTFVIKDGTIHIVDRSPEAIPETTLNAVQLTLLNDTIAVLDIKASGSAQGYGPVSALGNLNRITGVLKLTLTLSEVPVGQVIARHAERIAPGLAHYLSGLSGVVAVTDKVTYTPGAAKKWQHEVAANLKAARYTHPDLPWPVENIAADVHILNGSLKLEKASAEIAGAKVKLTLESQAGDSAKLDSSGPPSDDVMKCLEDHISKLELSIDGLALDKVLFQALSARAQRKWQEFSPVGQVDLSYKFSRESSAGGWKRELELRPKQIAMIYDKFPYPVADVRGWVKRTVTHSGQPITNVDLLGTAGGQTISIKGQITGDGEDPGINLRVSGSNVPIDDKLFAAFPAKYAEMVRRFKTAGRGDFVAEFVQAEGVNQCDNEFRIDIRDADFCHVDFPYPLRKVKGRLVVRLAASNPKRPIHPGETTATSADRDEIIFDGFTAMHADTTLTMSGTKQPIPGSLDKKLVLHFGSNNCPVDEDLKKICEKLKIGSVWNTFNPRGKLSFAGIIELLERAQPLDQPNKEMQIDPATDLKLTLAFAGANVTPIFFRYDLNELSGRLEYKEGCVKLLNLSAKHGDSRMKLAGCEARFCPDGTVWANLDKLEVKPLIVDEALIKALPGKLGPGIDELKIKGKAELIVNKLVVRTPPDPPANQKPASEPVLPVSSSFYQGQQTPAPSSATLQPDPIVYWELELKLIGASLDIGVAWDQVFGSVGCLGRYEGTHVGQIRGAFWLDRAAIAGQPVTKIAGRYMAAEQQQAPSKGGDYLPTELKFTDLSGELFHGNLGGEAHVSLTAPVRFKLWLHAADAQLEEVAQHFKLDKEQLRGIAQAQLTLSNKLDPMTGQLTVEGSGSIDVPTGKIGNLPILIDLVKILKFETPNKTAFEEAHAVFRIQGDRVKVQQIDLIGRAVCLGGSGEFDVSGNYVKFDFYTIMSQVLAQLMNSPVGDLTAFLSKNLFVIKLTRENGELKYKSVPVPVVTEPAQLVADRLRLRFSKMFGSFLKP